MSSDFKNLYNLHILSFYHLLPDIKLPTRDNNKLALESQVDFIDWDMVLIYDPEGNNDIIYYDN